MKEYWIIDPEPETVEVLALVNGRYDLVKRSRRAKWLPRGCCPGSRFPWTTFSGVTLKAKVALQSRK